MAMTHVQHEKCKEKKSFTFNTVKGSKIDKYIPPADARFLIRKSCYIDEGTDRILRDVQYLNWL